ncbi:hypothetical protein BCV69DRAFT_297550 [Microstroma glucosiphilum]|uniref:non-specific serine/threonine protein kinase n=1 Tax=Pseudomicrostroma glucosiphilum TaxID=1684307 RepID=A0A316UAJ6_9BASI|nr:hypothetical protein BCV69DRAFT_297550 [Pseudomicrostroma glucosiphilum]PWN22250.1 hypothetical protein BCV69DRAFT_297550 [Pseudomicrostroma glucosiphilum]
MSSSQHAQAAAPVVPVDSLALPLPPLSLVFSTSAAPDGNGFNLSRYNREGTAFDAKKAVIGKGGFGTVYRFERDDEFFAAQLEERQRREESSDRSAYATRDDAASFATASPASIATTLPDEMQVDNTFHPLTSALQAKANRAASNPSSATKGSLRPHMPPTQRYASANAAPSLSRTISASPQKPAGPAVIVVKVCRSPCGGAFDEMPKTGAARAAAKAADAALKNGDASGFHTRICRGEARIFRFLQTIAKRSGKSYSKLGVTRLLADLPLSVNPHDGTSFVDEANGALSAQMEEQTGPVPRLLVFERMVELDAVLTPKGWVKRKRQWTYAEVEAVSRDMSHGLAFLHANHIVHGDLKPSNVMLDSKTGVAKLIDLGASRRFVCVPNLYKESTSAVEELDQFLAEGTVPPQTATMVHTEGLGSLTGSPYFMAPEVLLQAGRYVDSSNTSRSILHDYVNCKHLLPFGTNSTYFDMAYEDFKRGWGIKSDIWSWACSVLALLLRTLPLEQKKSSSTICPFDFSFEDPEDSLEPRHRLHRGERALPRFHEWARRYPLRIVRITSQAAVLPVEAVHLSASMIEMLHMCLAHMDSRPSASLIAKALTVTTRTSVEMSSSPLMRTERQEKRRSLTLSIHSDCESIASHAYSPHNVDLRGSIASGHPYGHSTPRASYSNCSVLQPYAGGVYQRSFTSESSLAVPEQFPYVRDGVSPIPPSPSMPSMVLPFAQGSQASAAHRSEQTRPFMSSASPSAAQTSYAKDAANAEVMAASLAGASLSDAGPALDVRDSQMSSKGSRPTSAGQEHDMSSADPHEGSVNSGASSGLFSRTKGKLTSMLRPSQESSLMDVDAHHSNSSVAGSEHTSTSCLIEKGGAKSDGRKSSSSKGPRKSKSSVALDPSEVSVLVGSEQYPNATSVAPVSPTQRPSRMNLKFKGKNLLTSQSTPQDHSSPSNDPTTAKPHFSTLSPAVSRAYPTSASPNMESKFGRSRSGTMMSMNKHGKRSRAGTIVERIWPFGSSGNGNGNANGTGSAAAAGAGAGATGTGQETGEGAASEAALPPLSGRR